MFQRILFPTDGSECARRAAKVAADMARRYGAELHVLSVIDPYPFSDFGDASAIEAYITAAEEASLAGLEAVRRQAVDGLLSLPRIGLGVGGILVGDRPAPGNESGHGPKYRGAATLAVALGINNLLIGHWNLAGGT